MGVIYSEGFDWTPHNGTFVRRKRVYGKTVIPGTKEVLISDVFEALAKDGFVHIRGSWTEADVQGMITGGCVLQQGALNLGVTTMYAIPGEGIPEDSKSIDGAGLYGDEDPYGLIAQLNRFSIRKGSKWTDVPDNDDLSSLETLESRGLANVIITWNDTKLNEIGHYEYSDDGDVYVIDRPTGYALPTYQDVIEMAREVLAPYMDRKIILRERQWNYKRKDDAA